MIKRLEIQTAAVLFAVFLNADGFIALARPGYAAVGSYNYAVALLFLAVAALWLVPGLFLRPDYPTTVNRNFVFMAGVVFLLLVIQIVSYYRAGILEKGVRDVFYLCFFFIIGLYFLLISRGSPRNLLVFVAPLIVLNNVIFPLLSILGGVSGSIEGRFGSLQLTSSVFGMSVAGLAVVCLHLPFKAHIKYFVLLSSVFLLMLAGTRAALLIVASYLVVRGFGMWKGEESGETGSRWPSVVLVVIAASVLVMAPLVVDVSESRILSAEDLEGGSLATRLYWYSSLFYELSKESYLGGYGPGASEGLIGFITHLDPLRFWFDYGLIFLVLLLLLLFLYVRSFGCKSILIQTYLFGVFLLYSMHNVFQAPGLLLIFCLVLAVLARAPARRSAPTFLPDENCPDNVIRESV